MIEGLPFALRLLAYSALVRAASALALRRIGWFRRGDLGGEPRAVVKRRGSFRAGLGFGALSSLTLIALGLVSSVAIARVYGVEQIGRYALALAPSLALAYLSSAQEQAALVRALSVLEPLDPRATGLFAAVLAFSTALTLVVAAATIGVTVLVFEGPLGHPGLVGPAAALIASQAC